MASNEDLGEIFNASELTPEISRELKSIIDLYSIDAQELFYKWESYSMKMGAESTTMDLKTVREFRKDLYEQLERDRRGKPSMRAEDKRRVASTPKVGAGTSDVFGMLDSLVPNTPRSGMANNSSSTIKRKANFETPLGKANKSHPMSSPGTPHMNGDSTSFADRPNPGQILESLNAHISLPEPLHTPSTESRIKLISNIDMPKHKYKTMAMKLSEASEVLDDRIDEFMTLIQEYHKLDDTAFGNAAVQSTSEIVAVGRIASEDRLGKLNASSLVLEMSRRVGAGFRVPLKIEGLKGYEFFPGKIVALRGTNANGEFFTVTEVLSMPLLNSAASLPHELDVVNTRMMTKIQTDGDIDMDEPPSTDTPPLSILVAAGPYTTDTSLDFSPFQALLEQARASTADALILLGPFIDIEHPLIRTGDFDLPEGYPCEPDQATLVDLFKAHISAALSKLVHDLPGINIILVPSVRDAISKHVSYPQDRWNRKELNLPRQAQCVTNPVILSLNEIVVAISSLDSLDMIRANEVVGGTARTENIMARLCNQMLEQRHFLPVFPPPLPRANNKEGEEEWNAMGSLLDTSYLKLGEWLNVRPDILITPSILTPFAKVVNSVLCINPSSVSRRKGPGNFARVTVLPPVLTDEERAASEQHVGHKMWERARVDCVKI